MSSGAKQACKAPVIMVVDDEIGPRESLRIIFNSTYRVVAVTSGYEALTEFKRELPEVVLADVRMPGMSGTELLRELKSLDPYLPVILITGYAELHTAQEAVRNDAFDYIIKPYDVDELQKIVAKALSASKERRKHELLTRQLHSWNFDLQEQIGKLNQKAAVADLSAELIHDLNNPMTVLQGYISLLEGSLNDHCEENTTKNTDMEEFIGIVKSQVKKCIELTRNFLDFSRQSGENWEEGNLNHLLRDILFVLRIRMIRDRIDSVSQLDPNLPNCWFIPASMQQVFYNLVSNAIDAICENGKGGTITVRSQLVEAGDSSENPDRMIEIAIIDNGPGIPRETIPLIFNSFFSTKDKGKGTGLGLSICKRVVDKHQGKIWVESEPGHGTRFKITIPVLADKPQATKVVLA